MSRDPVDHQLSLRAVSPVILNGKQILQLLCHQNVNWDDPIPTDILPHWEKWRTELPLLEKLKFSHSLKPAEFGDPVKTETHSLSDASDNGIRQISYVRMINQRNEVHVSFLMEKSRVAPIKPISIPRLELTAAVVSVNVTRMLKSELDVENVKRYCYTDSEIVIGYINNDVDAFMFTLAIAYSISETAALLKNGFTSLEKKTQLMRPPMV